MKERELDNKKTSEQLVKDKEDLNHQMMLMQEGMSLVPISVLHCLSHCLDACCVLFI